MVHHVEELERDEEDDEEKRDGREIGLLCDLFYQRSDVPSGGVYDAEELAGIAVR